jgi:hypothetical protein
MSRPSGSHTPTPALTTSVLPSPRAERPAGAAPCASNTSSQAGQDWTTGSDEFKGSLVGEWRSLRVLPNPMDPAARHLYRLV